MKYKSKGRITIARKYKQVHRKEIVFELKDWEKIERKAAACHTDTTKYLRKILFHTQHTPLIIKNLYEKKCLKCTAL